MSPVNILMSIEVAAALALVGLFSLVEPLMAYHANRWLAGMQSLQWAWDHFLLPLLRALVVIGFVLLAYPSLYGARAAPALTDLLVQGSLRFTNLLNVVFVCSLLLPLLPLLRNRAAIVLPMQGLVATAILFVYYTDYLGATAASWWPGIGSALAISMMAVISHWLAVEIGTALGQHLDRTLNVNGLERIAANALELVMQTPVMLYYGLTLGQQIGI